MPTTELPQKVLDGISIDSEEQAASKDQYHGRLNLELLEERLGHRNYHSMGKFPEISLYLSIFIRFT